MDWTSLPGLSGLRSRWQQLLTEGSAATQDRLLLARLEWADYRRTLASLALLLVVFGVVLLLALLLLVLVVLLYFWETPLRMTAACVLAALVCAVAVVLLLLVRRAWWALARPFALTRRELARDWQAWQATSSAPPREAGHDSTP